MARSPIDAPLRSMRRHHARSFFDRRQSRIHAGRACRIGVVVAAVMIVDAVETRRHGIAADLSAAGHAVAQAGNCYAALACIAVAPIALVVVEVAGTETDGIALVKTLRDERNPAKLLAYAGAPLSMNGPLLAARAFGANLVLYHPFTRTELLAAIDALLT
jgi:DNA-binding response OmpR family regulator